MKKKVYVYGHGYVFNKLREEIKKKYEVLGFVDSYVCENNDVDGLPILSVDRVAKLNESVLIASIHFFDMSKSLIEAGVEEKRIEFADFLQFVSWGNDSIFSNGESLRVINGKVVLEGNNEKFVLENKEVWHSFLDERFRSLHPEIDMISRLINCVPVSRYFGSERGKPVDRFYIEEFLEKNKECVCGSVMEFGDDTYSKMYGGDRILHQYIAHVNRSDTCYTKIDLGTGEGVIDELADCIICTQVLQYVPNLKSAFSNIYRMLKPNGVALISVPGIKSISLQDDDNWGDRWSFTVRSVKELCMTIVDQESFSVESFGNVKVTIAYLYGLCVEDLKIEDFDYLDTQYPFLICAKIKK